MVAERERNGNVDCIAVSRGVSRGMANGMIVLCTELLGCQSLHASITPMERG